MYCCHGALHYLLQPPEVYLQNRRANTAELKQLEAELMNDYAKLGKSHVEFILSKTFGLYFRYNHHHTWMTHRRHFIRSTSLAAIAIAGGIPSFSFVSPVDFVSGRPEPGKRRFISKAVEDTIAKVKKSMADEELAWMFENCFPNTLDTTVTYLKKRPALNVCYNRWYWCYGLRDSSAQVWWPAFGKIRQRTSAVTKRCYCQTGFVCFVLILMQMLLWWSRKSKWMENDITEMKPWCTMNANGKSILFVMWSAFLPVITITQATLPYLLPNGSRRWSWIVQTFREQQRIHDHGPYRFQRNAANPTDTQFSGGYGNPTKRSVWYIPCSGHRWCYCISLLISNMFAVVSLKQLASVRLISGYEAMQAECNRFCIRTDKALKQHAVLQHPVCGSIFWK